MLRQSITGDGAIESLCSGKALQEMGRLSHCAQAKHYRRWGAASEEGAGGGGEEEMPLPFLSCG